MLFNNKTGFVLGVVNYGLYLHLERPRFNKKSENILKLKV